MNEGLILMAVGMAVVFSALSLMAFIVVMMRRILAETPPPVEKKEAQTEKAEAENLVDSQLIAILTAAASAALGARVRVYRVGFIADETSADHHSWVQQARSELHMSHRRRY